MLAIESSLHPVWGRCPSFGVVCCLRQYTKTLLSIKKVAVTAAVQYCAIPADPKNETWRYARNHTSAVLDEEAYTPWVCNPN